MSNPDEGKLSPEDSARAYILEDCMRIDAKAGDLIERLAKLPPNTPVERSVLDEWYALQRETISTFRLHIDIADRLGLIELRDWSKDKIRIAEAALGRFPSTRGVKDAPNITKEPE